MFNTKIVTLILVFLLNITGFNNKHPLHISTTEVDFNVNEKLLEISCKIFTDDFESILAKLYKQKIDLSKPEMKNAMDILVKKYIFNHLKITADDQETHLSYVGFEIDHEATNIYFEVDKIQTLKKLSVYNTILYDLFDDQMSIVHLVKGSTRKSGKILYPDKTFSANF